MNNQDAVQAKKVVAKLNYMGFDIAIVETEPRQDFTLQEHKLHEVLAMSLYLVVWQSENETLPHSYQLMCGDEIAKNNSNFSETTRFYLLPEVN